MRSLGLHDQTPKRLVARVAEAAAGIAMSPFVVALNRVVGWKGPRGRQPLVLTGDDGVIGVDILLERIDARFSEAGLPAPSKRVAIPHMTLLRGDVAGFQRIIEPVMWLVQDVVLTDSHVGESRHIVLFRQSLRRAKEA